jgi:hypothetical protein
MASGGIDLAQVFQVVTTSLMQNQAQLNQADTIDQNHGDDMVEIFKLITQAVGEKKSATPAQQLARASSLVGARGSGTARHYAAGLAQASKQVTGKTLTQGMVMQLLQTLVGGGRSTSTASSGGGDLMTALMGGLSGGTDGQIDGGDVLQAGLTFLSSSQGQQVLSNLMGSMTADEGQAPKTYRAQSGSVVTQAVLQMLSGMAKR